MRVKIKERRNGTIRIDLIPEEMDYGFSDIGDTLPTQPGARGTIATKEYVGIADPVDVLFRKAEYGWPGNSDHTIRRYHGWRGTTDNYSIYAHGFRKLIGCYPRNRGQGMYYVFSKDLYPNNN